MACVCGMLSIERTSVILGVSKKGIGAMDTATSIPVVTDAATLEEVVEVLQEHVPIQMEGE